MDLGLGRDDTVPAATLVFSVLFPIRIMLCSKVLG